MTPTLDPGPDDDLRRALHDAVSDVRPHGTLDDIRSRTDKVVPMKRWFLPTLAVAAVMAVVVGGAFWLVNGDDVRTAPSGTPTVGTSPSGTPSKTADGSDTETRAVPVYYVGATAHGKKLYREFQSQQICGTDDCLLTASTVAALSGDPADHDYTASWPSGTGISDVSFEGGTLTISLSGDVHDRPGGTSAADAELAVQQLIYSAQAGLGQGRPPVQLLIDGKHTDTVLGVPASEPLAAASPDDVLAPVQVDSPTNGATVSQTFTVTGRAATFEANVVWELTEDGKVVKHGFTTAQECCTLSPYSFKVTAPPGSYTLTVHDTDESGEGRPVDQDTKEITVQ
jgi:Immunoglobulin-like domain of bacterial spore germination/Sporulation and spore germination